MLSTYDRIIFGYFNSLFKYYNCNFDTEKLEYTLVNYGAAVIAKIDKKLEVGLLSIEQGDGYYNISKNATFSDGKVQLRVKLGTNAAPFFNTTYDMRQPRKDVIFEKWSKALYYAEKAYFMNLKNSKNPIVLLAKNDAEKKSIEKIYCEMEKEIPIITTSNANLFGENQIETKLLFNDVFNAELVTIIGKVNNEFKKFIQTETITKDERLSGGEVNFLYTYNELDNRFYKRYQGIQILNEIFGEMTKIEINRDLV